MKEKVKYWIDLADYDIETAKAMFETKRYMYVGFMCHQTIEKAMKAIIANHLPQGEIPPKMHDLEKLANIAGVTSQLSEQQQDFIDVLNPLNIESRYPEYKKQIQSILTREVCAELIKKSEELLCWTKKKLER